MPTSPSLVATLSPVYLVATAFAALFAIVYPLALAFLTHRRLGVSWRYFGYGALIFFVFQLITRVPAVTVLGTVLAPTLRQSRLLTVVWLIGLSLTAGLFEEVGRYVGYRWLMRGQEKTWSRAIMYGLGHGGLESIVLVGIGSILTLVNLIALLSTGLDRVPPNVRVQVAQQLATIAAQPTWLPLLGAWERGWTVLIQVAFSVIVLQVFRRGSLRWLWIAVGAHAVVDGLATIVPFLISPGTSTGLLTAEAIVTVFGLTAVWTIKTLREPADSETHEGTGTLPEGALGS